MRKVIVIVLLVVRPPAVTVEGRFPWRVVVVVVVVVRWSLAEKRGLGRKLCDRKHDFPECCLRSRVGARES